MIVKAGDVVNNRYEVKSFLGEGATARVWKAFDRKQGFDVALKVQQPQGGTNIISNLNTRFVLEGKALLSFNNKNIVRVYELFSIGKANIIVMELLEGKTVKTYLREKKQFTPKETMIFAVQILHALSYMHKKNIMHRDLKPENIIINYDNQVKLMDFGIIQVSQTQDLTKDQSIIGTVSYLAPEIIRQEQATPTSEIWSLGVLLYQMLTGVLPFKGSDINNTALKILRDKPVPLSELNPQVDPVLENIIFKMLDKDMFKRYRSADSVIDAIGDYVNNNSKVMKHSIDKTERGLPTKTKKQKVKMMKSIPILIGMAITITVIAVVLILVIL